VEKYPVRRRFWGILGKKTPDFLIDIKQTGAAQYFLG
jgi:hypothetical protein